MATTPHAARSKREERGRRRRPLFTREGKRALIWFGWPCAALLLLASIPLAYEWNFGYHAEPKPPGRVLSVRVGGDLSGKIGNRMRVELVQLEPAILKVHDKGWPPFDLGPDESRVSDPTQWFEFPSGRRLAVEARVAAAPLPFDFDGDGVEDCVTNGWTPGRYSIRAEVLSGATGAVLYQYDDLQEYSQEERAFPLGDLDGDGYAELALLHPRCDRSQYDPVYTDMLFGARSWLSIVSGKAVCAPR